MFIGTKSYSLIVGDDLSSITFLEANLKRLEDIISID